MHAHVYIDTVLVSVLLMKRDTMTNVIPNERKH